MLFVDDGDIGNRLAEGLVNGLSHTHAEVPFARGLRRTLLGAKTAARAFR